MPSSTEAHELILRLASDPQLLQRVTIAGTTAEKSNVLTAAGLTIPIGTGEVLTDEQIRITIQEIVGLAADETADPQPSARNSSEQTDQRAKDLVRILLAIGVYEMIPPPY